MLSRLALLLTLAIGIGLTGCNDGEGNPLPDLGIPIDNQVPLADAADMTTPPADATPATDTGDSGRIRCGGRLGSRILRINRH